MQFTKERLEELAVGRSGLNLRIATPEESMELARIALASLEAEAVCVIDQSNLDYLKSGSDADVWPASRTEMGDVLLYRAAPTAPVSVPDAYIRDDRGRMILNGKQEPRIGYSAGWNACRAAMLQGAEPVSNRDELPDGWVACSERMPGIGTRVLICDVEHSGVYEAIRFDGNRFNRFGCEIIADYWQPLPAAAPQQEVKS